MGVLLVLYVINCAVCKLCHCPLLFTLLSPSDDGATELLRPYLQCLARQMKAIGSVFGSECTGTPSSLEEKMFEMGSRVTVLLVEPVYALIFSRNMSLNSAIPEIIMFSIDRLAAFLGVVYRKRHRE